MMYQTGHFATAHASKYLQQLCKHFGHKVDARYDPREGRVAFAFGPARLMASDSDLTVILCAPDEAVLPMARGVIDSHLVTFAFREDFTTMTWAEPTAEAPVD